MGDSIVEIEGIHQEEDDLENMRNPGHDNPSTTEVFDEDRKPKDVHEKCRSFETKSKRWGRNISILVTNSS